MATLGATAGTLTCCGCDGVAAVRGFYSQSKCFAPVRLVRVFADAQKSSKGRLRKTNALDTNAVSLNSVTDDAREGVRALSSQENVLRAGVEKPKVVEDKNIPPLPVEQLLIQRLKLDKVMGELVGFMAPREKGDIRDVVLMSLSFAVLVYISQRLVCLYCVFRHMASQRF